MKFSERNPINQEVEDLINLIDSHIDVWSVAITAKWRGFSSIKTQYRNLEQKEFDNGKNFPQLHIYVMTTRS